MLFASATQPQMRRTAYAHPGRTMERFLDEALNAARNPASAYTQDDTAYTLSLDVPGIAREQLGIAIEGAVVRIQSKDDAPRRYRMAYEFPQELDAALSEAKLANGVLVLKLAKKVPVSNAAELTIQ